MVAGTLLASGVALYVRFENQNTMHTGLKQLLLLALILGPILEKSFFRGRLLPLIAQATGNVLAVIITALLFAVFPQPADLAHWVSFIATGVAYGWIRMAARSTTAAVVMHSTYNVDVFFFAAF